MNLDFDSCTRSRRFGTSRFGRHGAASRCWLGAVLLGMSACSGDSAILLDPGTVEEPAVAPAELFAMSHLVEVQIEMDPNDWDSLRHEGRDLIGVYTRTQLDYEYTHFEANVTIDGVRHEHVGLRKKGYWGSLSAVRPSFKIDFDRYDPRESHFGVEKLTLNNGRADLSRTHECMAYHLFERAGLPTSRCNLAHVVVNGQDLGTYSNVESIDKRMLARHFADNDGNLYEGQLTDFERRSIDAFELKTNEKKNDRSDLTLLVDALESDDTQLLERLGAIVDIDRFRDFWALEMLTGHWDGYSNNANNFMVYRDPTSGLFQFLPWGTDNAFERADPRRNMYADGLVAFRLYSLPAERQRLWDRFAELTNGLWDVEALLALIDQVAVSAPDVVPALLDQERQFVSTRAERLRAIFGGKPPGRRGSSTSRCEGTVGDISGVFDTTFASTMTPVDGTSELQVQLSLDGEPVVGVEWSGSSDFDSQSPVPLPAIRYDGTFADGREITLQLYVEASTFQPGPRQFHGGETYGAIIVRIGGVERFVGNIGSGSLDLVEASAVAGAPVRGSFGGRIYQFGCAS